MTPGERFRAAVEQASPLQVVGAINTYCAIMAKAAGFSALYLSGAGVANACYGLPDLGMTSVDNVAEEVRRMTARVDLPLLVDADTGWGNALNVAHTIRVLEAAGAAAVHIEDQVFAKRCGHRDKKRLVSTEEMCERLQAACEARRDKHFVIMARTDAFASEGLEASIERARAYIRAGADMLFAEALTQLEDYRAFVDLGVPVMANITEFGKTPLFTCDELRRVGVRLVLYPLSAFRAMNQAALDVYATIKQEGTQKKMLDKMQTRETLYHYLDYLAYEEKQR